MTEESALSLGDRSRDLAARVADLLAKTGRHPAAAELREDLERHALGELSVVVAGETKRGKSSFVNALLGRPGLSPVDVDVATNVHLVFRHAEHPYVRVHRAGGTTEEIVPEAIALWATVAGNPGNARAAGAIEVGLDHPLLARGVSFVDTPGAGGVEAAHAAVTLAALRKGDALLFLFDASAPISDPEIRFLERATRRVSSVIFVLTKVDAYPGWRTILEEDRAVLARRAPALAAAPVVPVSSALALRALSFLEEDPDLAAELREESGFAVLDEVLDERVLAHAERVRLGNLLAHVSFALTTLEMPERATIAAATGDEQLKRALEAEQLRWQEFSKDNSAWTTRLADQMQDLRFRITGELTRKLADLKRYYDERIRRWEPELADELPVRLTNDMRGLMAGLEESLEAGIVECLAALAEGFGLEALDVDAPTLARGDVTPLFTEQLERPPLTGKVDPATLVGMASSGFLGFNLVRMLLAPVLGAATLPVGGAAAVLVGGVITVARRKTQHQQEARGVVNATLAEAGAQARQEVDRRLAVVGRTIRDQMKALFERRAAELQAGIARHQQLVQADQATRQQAKTLAQRRLQHLTGLRQEADRLAAELHAAGER